MTVYESLFDCAQVLFIKKSFIISMMNQLSANTPSFLNRA